MAKKKIEQENLALLGIDYVNKKDAIKELTSQCNSIRVPLEEALSEKGKVLPNGSKVLVLSHADVDVHLKHTLRTGSVLRAEALDVLKELHLDKECVENVPTIREDIIQRLYESGKISGKDMKRIFAEKETYAFSVSLKNKCDE